MVLAGTPRSASSTTCTTAPGGRRYDDPNAMGGRCSSGARGRHPDHPAGHLLPPGGLTPGGHLPLDDVQQRFSDGSVQAWGEAGGASSPATTHLADRGGRALRAGGAPATTSPRWVSSRRRDGPTVARARVGAAGREPRVRGRSTGARRPSCSPGEGLLDADDDVVHATHLSDADVVGARRRPGRPRASARRPSATSPTARSRPAACTTPGRRSRWGPTSTPSSTPSRRSAVSRCTNASRAWSAAGSARPTSSGWRTPLRVPVARLGRRRPDRRRATSQTSWPSASTAHERPAAPGPGAVRRDLGGRHGRGRRR